MLKFFFGKNSKFVLTLELIGIAGFAGIIFTKNVSLIFSLYALSYILIRFCAFWDWYKKFEVRGSKFEVKGVCTHFKKIVVLAAYTIAITNFFVLFFDAKILIYFSFALLAFALHINFILIYFHFKDKDKTPPNFFSLAN